MNHHLKTALTAAILTLAVLCPAILRARRQAPIIEFHTQLYEMYGAENAFHIELGATEDTYVDVDFGFGMTEYEISRADFDYEAGDVVGTKITGRVGPEGIVRVYGDPALIDYLYMQGVYADELDISSLTALSILNVRHNLLKELDLSPQTLLEALYIDDNPFDVKPFLLGSDHPRLTILSMHGIGLLDQSFDISDYPELKSFSAYSTHDLRRCDPTGCPKLLQLSIDCTNVETLDVSQNPELMILDVSQTKIDELDLSNNLNLQQLYLANGGVMNPDTRFRSIDVSMLSNLRILAVGGNSLTGLDVSGCPQLFELGVSHNELTEIDLSANPSLYNVDVSMNHLDFATLPEPRPTFGEYYYYQKPFEFDRSYPVETIIDLQNRLSRPNSVTTARLMCGDTELGNEYFGYDDGVVEFYKATPDSVKLVFSNTLFTEYSLETTKFMVKEVADFGKDSATAAWRLKPAAKTVTLKAGMAGATPETPKRFSIDFGDGIPVEYTTSTNLLADAAVITAEKKGIGAMTLYIPEGEDLTALSITGTPLSTIDVSDARSLTHLEVRECAITDIDLSRNRRLQCIDVSDNALTKLDLRGYDDKWTKSFLTDIRADRNEISEFMSNESHSPTLISLADNRLDNLDLTKYSRLTSLDVSGNILTEIDLQDCESLVSLNIAANDIADLYIPTYTPLEVLDISLNRFPMSTLPLPGCVAEYTYAPQKEWMMPAKAPSVDLTAQIIDIDGHSTQFRWYAASDGRELTGDQVKRNGGKFKFIDTSIGEVYATWTNEAFPQFAGDDVYRTTDIMAAEPPAHVAASFSCLSSGDAVMTLRSAIPNNYVYVDWAGDGDMEQYALDHTTYTGFPVETYADTEVKVYTYDERDAITVFSLSGITVGQIDLTPMTDLYALHIINAGLTPDRIKFPHTSLTEINLSGNEMTGLDLSGYPELYMIKLMQCGLTEFDATPFKKLGLIYLSGNYLTDITLDNPALWNLDLGGNRLESVDLSRVPRMYQMWLSGNRLSTLDVSMLRELRVMDLTGNLFTLTTLPRILSTYSTYAYGNQAPYPAKVEEGCRVDLSDQLMVGVNRTGYRWFRNRNVGFLEDGTIGGDELTAGTDYEEHDGVFTFNVPVHDAVCVMTNVAFPNLIYLSEPVDIAGSGVEGIADGDEPLSVAVTEGGVVVTGARAEVRLWTPDGRLAAAAMPVDGRAEFKSVATGLYIVTDAERSLKIIVK